MRQLHFVRPADDGTHLLVETDDGGEQFHLRYDARLHEIARPDVAHHQPFGEPSSPITPPPVAAAAPPPAAIEIGPREIQMRVRAGESPAELAESLGVAVERVLRFAGPVMGERRRIADEARRARAHRTVPDGAETKIVVFGEAVDARFTAHGIAPVDVTWDARRRDDDGEWIIVAAWLGGEGRHTADWLFHRASRSVSPLDDTAADLLSDRPIRPVTPAPAPAQRPSLAAAPPLVAGVVSFPALPDAHTGPLPAIGEDVFDQETDHLPAPHAEHDAADGADGTDGGTDESATSPIPLDAGINFDAPPLPLGIADPSTRPGAVAAIASLRNLNSAKRHESDEDRAARARVPSWDDILLGVRRKQD